MILTQAAVPAPSAGTNSVVLDLDVFKEDADIGDDNVAWGLLENLRARKNQFFEGSITPTTRKLFGQRKEY